MNDMERAILCIIEKRYKRKYVGGIKVTKLGLGEEGYKLVLDLGIPDKRTIQIAADVSSEDEFLKFVEQELISRQLEKVKFFRGVVNYPEDDQRTTYK